MGWTMGGCERQNVIRPSEVNDLEKFCREKNIKLAYSHKKYGEGQFDTGDENLFKETITAADLKEEANIVAVTREPNALSFFGKLQELLKDTANGTTLQSGMLVHRGHFTEFNQPNIPQLKRVEAKRFLAQQIASKPVMKDYETFNKERARRIEGSICPIASSIEENSLEAFLQCLDKAFAE